MDVFALHRCNRHSGNPAIRLSIGSVTGLHACVSFRKSSDFPPNEYQNQLEGFFAFELTPFNDIKRLSVQRRFLKSLMNVCK